MGEKCEVRPLDKMRQIILEISSEGKRWNHVHGLMQIDITATRRMISAIKADGGEAPSMTGFIISCLARAIDQNKSLHAIRKGRNVHIFDDVDVSTVIERDDPTGNPVPTSIIIRAANKKPYRAIHDEIKKARRQSVSGSVLGESKQAKRTNMLIRLPAFIRKLVWWWSRRSPQFRKDSMGTVHVTAVGMFADGFDAGWAIPVAPWPLILTIGTISKRLQRMPDGEDGMAEFINLTLTIDHDVVDGAPATRFLVHFKQLLESGDGLESFRSA